MKLVYTHENFILVGNARALLERADIATTLRNEFTGGGRGDIPVFETWPELWVERDRDAERALALLKQLTDPAVHADWVCTKCGESNAASFELCWHCEADNSAAEGELQA